MAYTYQGRSVVDVKLKEKPPGPGVVTDVDKENYANCHVFEEKELELYPRRVENLVWIKSNTFYKEALSDCKEQKKALDAKIKDGKKSKGEVTNEIYNLVGFFSVFQGVILTAVTQLTQTTQPPRPFCGKVWFPVTLSVLGAIAAVVGIGLKHRDLHTHQKDEFVNRQLQVVVIQREEELKKKGASFLFRGGEEEQERRNKKETRGEGSRPFRSYLVVKSIAVIGLVVVLTVFFILSYFVIMCDMMVIEGWQ